MLKQDGFSIAPEKIVFVVAARNSTFHVKVYVFGEVMCKQLGQTRNPATGEGSWASEQTHRCQEMTNRLTQSKQTSKQTHCTWITANRVLLGQYVVWTYFTPFPAWGWGTANPLDSFRAMFAQGQQADAMDPYYPPPFLSCHFHIDENYSRRRNALFLSLSLFFCFPFIHPPVDFVCGRHVKEKFFLRLISTRGPGKMHSSLFFLPVPTGYFLFFGAGYHVSIKGVYSYRCPNLESF